MRTGSRNVWILEFRQKTGWKTMKDMVREWYSMI